ncbi:hypothetical protein NGA_0626200, partial [Nannochloropsis gaditana CCMP526]|uniref:uncharacterized protein n=1 Tax=Nannochloropsis gaditana (strain CCMP526) TaxID=1093141 RepID=UPI00029F66A2
MTRLLFYFSLTPRLCASVPFPLSKDKDKLLSPPADVRMAVQGKKEANLWKPMILAVCFLGVALTEMVQGLSTCVFGVGHGTCQELLLIDMGSSSSVAAASTAAISLFTTAAVSISYYVLGHISLDY